MSIRPIKNHIVFEFVDSITSSRQFTQTTESGIVITANFDTSAKEPRWGRVIATGPDVDPALSAAEVEILIENLKWTEGVEYNGQKYWRTDETQVLGYRPT